VRAKEVRLEETTDTDAAFELVAQIAHHWEAAQVEPKAFAAIVRAARSAARLFAVTEADEYFSRALAMDCAADESTYEGLDLDRLDLLLEASQAAHMVGDGPRAIGWVDAAAGMTADPARLASVLERKGAYCFNTGRVEEADRAYREALRLLPDEPSPLRARVLGGLALLSMAWSRMTEAEALCHRAISDARAVDARHAEVRALNALGVVMSYRGEVEQGILHSREAVAIAEELDSPDDMATAYIDLAHVLDLAGRFGEAVEVCRVGYDAMRRVGLARQDGSFLQANAAESLVKAGRWEQAADLLAQAQAVQTRGLRAFPVLEHEARLRTRSGDFAAAEECVQRARQLFEEYDAPDAWHREFHEVAAELYLWQGRPNDALNEAHAGLVLVEGGDEERMAGPLILTALQALADLIEMARTQSDSDGLERHVAEAESLRARAAAIGAAAAAAGFLLPEAAAVLQTIEAEYARCVGQDCGPERWSAVADKWARIGQPFGAVYANWREAETLVMSKEVGQRPVAAVRHAWEAAERLGARAIVAEVENLARWGRVTLHPSAPEDLARADADEHLGLTRREQEVLAGLLAGKTNREIAEEMFISTKTSSVHVSNILRKLGVKSREEAARVAHRKLTGG
jgi:DNA-binding CsgD family transcriptional regulator/tetratricopeptide (TPR) repeat protein